jgi:nicotinamide mononucleotide transporter
MSLFELSAALITAWSVWLTARENVWCWPTGIVSVVLYAWIFWQAKLYANAVLQVVYLVLIIYGWYEWLYGGARGGELVVARTPLRGWIVTMSVGAAVTAAAATLMTRYTDASMPLSDAATTAFSIVAEAMTARKWIENWLIWIAVDAWTTWMLVVQKLYASAALYAVFVPLAVYGWMKWRRSLASV